MGWEAEMMRATSFSELASEFIREPIREMRLSRESREMQPIGPIYMYATHFPSSSSSPHVIRFLLFNQRDAMLCNDALLVALFPTTEHGALICFTLRCAQKILLRMHLLSSFALPLH